MKLSSIKSYFKKYGFLSDKHLLELKKFIKIDKYLNEAIDLIEYCDATELSNELAILCKHKDKDIRGDVMACLLGHMRLSRYALLAVERYEVENDFEVKARILFNLGYVINDIEDNVLRKRVAEIIIEGLDKKDKDIGYEYRAEAYHSILTALNISIKEQPNFVEDVKKEDTKFQLIQDFRDYFLNNFKGPINISGSLIFSDIKNLIEFDRLSLYKTKLEFTNLANDKNKEAFLKWFIENRESSLKYKREGLEGLIGIYENLIPIEEMQNLYLENGYLDKDTIQDLMYHILYDKEPVPAVILAAYCGATELANDIASICKHEDEYVREEVMACLLGYMRLSDYALLAVERYEKEDDFGVKARILFNLGYVINDIKDYKLKKRVAEIILEGLDKRDEETGYEYRTEAYHSIVTALNIPIEEQPNFIENIRRDNINNEILEEFKKIPKRC